MGRNGLPAAGNTKTWISIAATPKLLQINRDVLRLGGLYPLDPSKTFPEPWEAQRRKGWMLGRAGGEPPGPSSPAWKQHPPRLSAGPGCLRWEPAPLRQLKPKQTQGGEFVCSWDCDQESLGILCLGAVSIQSSYLHDGLLPNPGIPAQ